MAEVCAPTRVASPAVGSSRGHRRGARLRASLARPASCGSQQASLRPAPASGRFVRRWERPAQRVACGAAGSVPTRRRRRAVCPPPATTAGRPADAHMPEQARELGVAPERAPQWHLQLGLLCLLGPLVRLDQERRAQEAGTVNRREHSEAAELPRGERGIAEEHSVGESHRAEKRRRQIHEVAAQLSSRPGSSMDRSQCGHQGLFLVCRFVPIGSLFVAVKITTQKPMTTRAAAAMDSVSDGLRTELSCRRCEDMRRSRKG